MENKANGKALKKARYVKQWTCLRRMTHLQLKFPPVAVGPPCETDLWPSARIWPTCASQSNHWHQFKQQKEINAAAPNALNVRWDQRVCGCRPPAGWAMTHGGLRVWWLWCARCCQGYFLLYAGGRHRMYCAEPRQNLLNNNNNSTAALGTFPFVKMMYMPDYFHD